MLVKIASNKSLECDDISQHKMNKSIHYLTYVGISKYQKLCILPKRFYFFNKNILNYKWPTVSIVNFIIILTLKNLKAHK